MSLCSCSLFIAYGVYTTLEWGVGNKSSKGAFWEIYFGRGDYSKRGQESRMEALMP